MATAKDIIVKPIKSSAANALIKSVHYSGKVVQNSALHFGVFLGGKLEGAMSFGPSLDKRKMLGLVKGTLWNEFLELNRMAFSEALPRNSESRALSVAFKLIRKHYPHIKWVVSFADGCQCGDGTIYRASGFVLTAIKENNQIWEAPSGERFSRMSLTDGKSKQQQQQQAAVVASRTTLTKGKHILGTGGASMQAFKAAGWKPKEGYQLRYIYFLHLNELKNLTVPVLPFSEIDRRGAAMYKGKSIKRPQNPNAADQVAEGRGSTDPDAPSL